MSYKMQCLWIKTIIEWNAFEWNVYVYFSFVWPMVIKVWSLYIIQCTPFIVIMNQVVLRMLHRVSTSPFSHLTRLSIYYKLFSYSKTMISGTDFYLKSKSKQFILILVKLNSQMTFHSVHYTLYSEHFDSDLPVKQSKLIIMASAAS